MVLLLALDLSTHGVHRARLYEMNGGKKVKLLIIIISGHSWNLLTSLLTLAQVIKM